MRGVNYLRSARLRSGLRSYSSPVAHSSPVHSKKSSSSNGWNLALLASLVALGPAPETKKNKLDLIPTVSASALPVSQTPRIPGVPFATYVIIGGGTASYHAMEAIKSVEPNASILMISDQEYVPYERPPLSKEMWFSSTGKDFSFKDWEGKKKRYTERNCSIFYLPKEAYSEVNLKNISLANESEKVYFLKNTAVDHIDTETKVLAMGKHKIQYSKVLIATGGTPKTIPLVDSLTPEARSKVKTFRTLQDFIQLDALAKGQKTIAIIGGGFLGSELAVALAQRKNEDLKVVQIFPEKGNMGLVLPSYLSQWTKSRVEKVKANSHVVGLVSKDSKIVIQLKSDENVVADTVLLAVGLEPNVQLAKNSGLEIDSKLGGIVDVFAAGDCTSFHDISLGRRRVEHYDHAVHTGRRAGLNMTGAKKPFLHQSMFWSNLGPEVSYEAVGILDAKVPTVSVWAKLGEKEEYEKGVVYYQDSEKRITGVLLWNLPGHLETARHIINSKNVYEPKDLAPLVKVYQ